MLSEQEIHQIAQAVKARQQSENKELVALIREEISEELDTRRTIPVEDHRDHHTFVAYLIEQRRQRRERWEAVRRHVLGWGIVAAITTFGYAIGDTALKWIHRVFS